MSVANKSTKKSVKRAPSTSSSSETKVTRITASDKKAPSKKTVAEKPAVQKTAEKKVAPAETPKKQTRAKRRNPFAAIGGYFKGAWAELRQVRWPDRRATWSMTGALIVFTLCFVVVILLLDALFQYLFSLVVK